MSHSKRHNDASGHHNVSIESQTRVLLAEMEERVLRQRKRIEFTISTVGGPVEEMQSLLTDMINARDLLHVQLHRFDDDNARQQAARSDDG